MSNTVKMCRKCFKNSKTCKALLPKLEKYVAVEKVTYPDIEKFWDAKFFPGAISTDLGGYCLAQTTLHQI